MLFASAAQAQSSLTIYGIVDSSLQYVKFDRPVSPSLQAASGNLQASRFGFRGSEDLGGGYKANFQLEAGFNTYTGVAGGSTLWNRGSAVGLSTPYGSMDFGYMYLPIYWAFLGSDVSTYGLSNPAAIMSLEHTVTLGRSGTGGFYPNALRYRTPNMGGLTAELGYSFGAEKVGNQSQDGRNVGFSTQYTKGPLYLAYGVNRYQYYLTPTTPDASSQITQVVSGTYDLGKVVIGGNYLYTKRTDATNFFASAEMLNAKIPLGFGDINIGAARRIENGGARAMAYDIGYVHYLSKRTQLYTYGAYISNNSKSTQGFALLGPSFASVQPGFKPWAFTAGLRTSF
ncbi:porin [Cupriavidus sp. TMH.W2]|uniref:porin n=1 Tax=Cupriavidus sp. TMH.W2 TaxID=3434465 RepID=UPI003D7865F6